MYRNKNQKVPKGQKNKNFLWTLGDTDLWSMFIEYNKCIILVLGVIVEELVHVWGQGLCEDMVYMGTLCTSHSKLKLL